MYLGRNGERSRFLKKQSSKKHGRRLYLVEIHLLLYQLDMANPAIIYAILPSVYDKIRGIYRKIVMFISFLGVPV